MWPIPPTDLAVGFFFGASDGDFHGEFTKKGVGNPSKIEPGPEMGKEAKQGFCEVFFAGRLDHQQQHIRI